jgi:hypothetical protein
VVARRHARRPGHERTTQARTLGASCRDDRLRPDGQSGLFGRAAASDANQKRTRPATGTKWPGSTRDEPRFSRSFNGGELTPEFFGQVTDSKYQTGLATCRNFRILPHGPAQNRAGFEFVREVKDSTKLVRLLPFEYSTTQTMVSRLATATCGSTPRAPRC